MSCQFRDILLFFNLKLYYQYRCKCGNCSRDVLSNPNECLCCCEIDECGQALVSEQVLNDVGQDARLKCITEHPGFDPVCLQKWSLRMAADKYKTKNKARYNQMDSEDRLVYKYLILKAVLYTAYFFEIYKVVVHLWYVHVFYTKSKILANPLWISHVWQNLWHANTKK